MRHFELAAGANINSPEYWDTHQTAVDFGLRQQKYKQLAGMGNFILDAGCGLSPFLNGLGNNFLYKWGLDYSPETIKKCRELYPECYFLRGDVTIMPFEDKCFDVVVCGEVIEHIEDFEKVISEMARVAKRRIIISTPKLEFTEPEHLWEFEEQDLLELLKPYAKNFNKPQVETINSERFPGRSYMFAWCDLK